jgi:nitronate monooxygenase
MAGGPSTVDLVVAVSRAGAFGFLAGGYKTAEVLSKEMAGVRAAGVEHFGVNLFLPGRPTTDSEGLAAYLRVLAAEAAALGTTLGDPEWDDDDYPRKLDLLLAEPPAVVSFTFGVPAPDVVRALQDAGSLVVVTVSTPEEAGVALRVGPDALCLQGSEAGAHRGSLSNDFRPDADRPIRALLAAVWGRTLVPSIAAGGVDGPADVRDLLTRGATLVQAGTAFLRCPESGADPLAKAALADPSFGSTAVTRAFSGRRARALVNAMVRDHAGAPAAYPEINNATRPLRAAAAAAGDPQHMSLYAGAGYRRAEARAASEVVAHLASGGRG